MSRHVVVGAGSVGSALALLLAERGEEVVVLTRSGSGPEHPRVRRMAGDASSTEVVREVSRGAAALYSCANPPYHRWPVAWPPIAEALLTAAQAEGAVLVTVSNLYGYGPVDVPMTEDLPLAAVTVKGRVRADIWRRALAAHDAGGVRIVEVRGSDYLCPGLQSALGDRVMRPLLAARKVRVLGSADEPHTWTSPADVARLAVATATDERAWGRAWHVPSPEPRTQRAAVEDLAAAAGVRARVGTLPDVGLRLVGLVSRPAGEMREMLYEFDRPFVMDSAAAQEAFGIVPTPWEQQIVDQVAAYHR